jgi:hypothetical protein
LARNPERKRRPRCGWEDNEEINTGEIGRKVLLSRLVWVRRRTTDELLRAIFISVLCKAS